MLLMIAPAPVLPLPGGKLRLDHKFVEGMNLHARAWDGPVRVILHESGPIPFGVDVAPETLGWEVMVLKPGEALERRHLSGARAVFASADMDDTLALPELLRGSPARLVYTLEYTLETRLRICWLDADRSVLRRIRSTLWLLGQERRRALRAADALQSNGWPAERAYGGMVRDSMMYLDGRMEAGMFATPGEMAARVARLRSGAPLRIAHFGRLERMKGAQDLLPFARVLREKGVDFTLDIWGAGVLKAGIAAELQAGDLAGRVRLHAPLPFDSGLVPLLRREADLFLSCHRQPDPSCSYVEAMGCGLAVIGYANAMWQALAEASGGGRVVPMADPAALAAGVAAWDRDREALIASGAAALRFARAHDFETEFIRRMEHLARVAEAGGLRIAGMPGGVAAPADSRAAERG